MLNLAFMIQYLLTYVHFFISEIIFFFTYLISVITLFINYSDPSKDLFYFCSIKLTLNPFSLCFLSLSRS